MYGDQLIQLGVNDEIAAQVIDVQTGQPLKSLVTNEGKLKANGGRVELTAVAGARGGRLGHQHQGRDRGQLGRHAQRQDRARRRDRLEQERKARRGRSVKVSGKISVAGKKKGTTGGTVLITGEDIQFANAMIDASGRAGGGKVLIGGDWGGGNPDQRLVEQSERGAGILRDRPRLDGDHRRRHPHQRLGDGQRQWRQGDPVVGRGDHVRRRDRGACGGGGEAAAPRMVAATAGLWRRRATGSLRSRAPSI